MPDLATFAKVSTGPDDEGLAWVAANDAGQFNAVVRWRDGDDVLHESPFLVAAFDQYTLAQVHFKAVSNPPFRATSDPAPGLPENHVQIAP